MHIKLFVLISLLNTPFYSFANNVTVNVLGNNGKAVENIVVYLEPTNKTIVLPRTDKTIEVTQSNKSFAPYISVIQVGNTVQFSNKDDITHHIYSPIGKNKFEYKILAGESKIKKDFMQADEVAMGCNIHDWMSGYLLVLDTPYFEKTNKQGKAEITVKQAGDYQLIIWHPQLDKTDHKLKQKVTIKENSTFDINVANIMKAIPKQKSNDDFDFLSDY